MEIIATNAYRSELAARAVTGASAPRVYKVAFGDGDALEDPTDTALENELFRVDPDSVTSDGVTLTVSATIDYGDTAGEIVSEIGVFAEIEESEVLMGRKIFSPKELTEPDRSEFTVTFTF
jgi:hypothetical protein